MTTAAQNTARQNVSILDMWGKSSDAEAVQADLAEFVSIPDMWGKSSDWVSTYRLGWQLRLNPRYVGQVFRQNVTA